MARPFAVGLSVALMTVALSGCATGFPAGAGTATITWRGVSGAPLTRPQPYSGTIAGVPVSGDTRARVPQLAGGHFPPKLVVARRTGRFQGQTFNINLSVKNGGVAEQPIPYRRYQWNLWFRDRDRNCTVPSKPPEYPSFRSLHRAPSRHWDCDIHHARVQR